MVAILIDSQDHALFSGLDAAEEGTSELEGMCENPRKPKTSRRQKRNPYVKPVVFSQRIKKGVT